MIYETSFMLLIGVIMFVQTALPYTKTDDRKSNSRDARAEIWLTVNDYPAGDGPQNITCNGIPFRQGVLFDAGNVRLLSGETEVPIAVKVLAYWPDSSIRILLIQFSAEFVGKTRKYMLKVGSSSGRDNKVP